MRRDQVASPAGALATGRTATVLLPAELTTAALALWAAPRLDGAPALSLGTWMGAMVAYIGVVSGLSAFRGGKQFGYVMGPALLAVVVKLTAANLSWGQAAALGVLLALSLFASRWLLSIAKGSKGLTRADGLRWSLLMVLAAYAIHPYVRCALVGAGDAYHYAISAADFVGQVKAGVFPVFIGQTRFAFNGGIHTLRTAPYFTHVCGLLDFLTVHSLAPFALCNLAILFSAVMAALGAYAAALLFAPSRPWIGLALGALYILSPAILAPLFEEDMIATFMAAPMIPWLMLGIALAADDADGWRPWLFQATALAGLWWAHPPLAFWATALCAGATLVLFVHRRITRPNLARIAMAAILFALLSAYEFASVLTLRLPPGPDSQATGAATILGIVKGNWRAAFEPLSSGGSGRLGDIQIGYGLLACALAGILVPRARRSGGFLVGCMLCFLVLLVPAPGVTAWLWSHVPKTVLSLTNVWPMQRIYPLLAGIALFAALAGLSELRLGNSRRAAFLATALCLALGWSLTEAQKLISRADKAAGMQKNTALLFRPENLMLTRVSYMFFGSFPGYFSNAPMEPFLEMRLLDARTLAVVADGTTLLPSSRDRRSATVEFVPGENGAEQVDIPIGPAETRVLRFDFLGREPRGELQFTGRTLLRSYGLPSSGEDKSFGAGPSNARVLAIQNEATQPDLVRMRFVPDPATPSPSGAFARVSVEPFETTGHVVELRSLLPFRAYVHAEGAAILETPKVDVPGYRATVDGRVVGIVRTADGLVGVPVPAGASEVGLDYPGPALLRWAYGISAASWLVLAACLMVLPAVGGSARLRTGATLFDVRSRRMVGPALVAVAFATALAVGAPRLWRRLTASDPGNLRLVVRLAAENAGEREPLVTTGQTGRADLIYLISLGGNRVSVGHDHWGTGGVVSEPFEVNFALPQTIDIAMKSLGRRPLWGKGDPNAGPHGVVVRWNGRVVLSSSSDSYPPGAVDVAANAIGATTCGPRFMGEVLDAGPVYNGRP
jgi:hypothetical protein